MDKLCIAGTVRASFGVYNDRADIDALAAAVEACREMFSR
jgi:selenocysteine lyase/cysteine desulfurase